MKNVILLLLSVCGMLACTHTPKWELVWEDNFDGAEPDTTIWSRIPRGRPDWKILSHLIIVVMKCVMVV